MLRRMHWVCALVLFVPAIAHANAIVPQGGGNYLGLAHNTAGQTFSLLLTGNDPYSASDLKIQINGGVGPAPFITAVFGDTDGGTISPAALLGSIWVGGNGGITSDPDNVANGVSSGLTTGGGFATPAFAGQTTNGIYVTLTISTVGVPAGLYEMTFNGTTMVYYDEEFNMSPVPLELPTLIIGQAVPEPSTYALAAMGGAALLTIRRARGKGAIASRG